MKSYFLLILILLSLSLTQCKKSINGFDLKFGTGSEVWEDTQGLGPDGPKRITWR